MTTGSLLSTDLTLVYAVPSEEDSSESTTNSPTTRRIRANNPTATQNNNKEASMGQILLKAAKRGLGGGIPGALAGVVQVFTLMW